MEAAKEVFNESPEKDSVSWAALIAGYVRLGSGDQALEMFREMVALRVRPEQFAFSSCLCAYACHGHGSQIHGYMIRTNVGPNAIIISSLIDMYSKSGRLEAVERVFDLCGDKQDCVAVWNTMISALAQHGLGHKALRVLDDMIRRRVVPNRTTLVLILSACSHSGLVEQGDRWFDSMTVDYGIVPDNEHYACLIDFLGRAGCFKELMSRIEKMPFRPDKHIWNAILGVSGNWETVEELRGIMEKRRVNKEKALSWIEIEQKVDTFTFSDRWLHPREEEIYSVLHNLVVLMEEEEVSRT